MIPKGFCACPVDVTCRILGKKWTVLLLRNMLRGEKHFNQFMASIPGINPKTLSARLKELERERLVVKRVAKTSPLRVEYRLTERGCAVLPILRQMARWSLTYEPERVLLVGRSLREVERCLEEWQDSLVDPEEELVLERRPDVIAVHRSRGRR